MTAARNRASAKKAGTCDNCGRALAVPQRKTCSRECLNAIRRRRYTPRPRSAKRSLAERLWSRVERMPTGCWEWQGYRMPFGHGQIALGGGGRQVTTTHRAAWMVAHGDPGALIVRHKCDNPPCVNPHHLELGTAADNSHDAVKRGRTARGATHPNTRLTDADIATIRREYAVVTIPGQRGRHSNRKELARRFGVQPKYIADIAAGRERADV